MSLVSSSSWKQLCWTQTDITANFPKDLDWLTLSCFVLKLTNVYDNTNELFFCTEMCIPNTTKAVFCILIIFKFHFSHILLILVTVRCTYWGPLWWRDSVILTVGKKKKKLFFSFFSGYVVAIVMTKKIPVMCTCPYVLLQWFSVSLYSPSPGSPLLVCVSLPSPSLTPLS